MHVEFLFYTEHWLHQALSLYRHITIKELTINTFHRIFWHIQKPLREDRRFLGIFPSVKTETSTSIQSHRREEAHPAGCWRLIWNWIRNLMDRFLHVWISVGWDWWGWGQVRHQEKQQCSICSCRRLCHQRASSAPVVAMACGWKAAGSADLFCLWQKRMKTGPSDANNN